MTFDQFSRLRQISVRDALVANVVVFELAVLIDLDGMQ
jgi:hypothetical protein